ncbi:MAG: hypothetical protein AABW48_04165 [Nanoarchaeota archaeon]
MVNLKSNVYQLEEIEEKLTSIIKMYQSGNLEGRKVLLDLQKYMSRSTDKNIRQFHQKISPLLRKTWKLRDSSLVTKSNPEGLDWKKIRMAVEGLESVLVEVNSYLSDVLTVTEINSERKIKAEKTLLGHERARSEEEAKSISFEENIQHIKEDLAGIWVVRPGWFGFLTKKKFYLFRAASYRALFHAKISLEAIKNSKNRKKVESMIMVIDNLSEEMGRNYSKADVKPTFQRLIAMVNRDIPSLEAELEKIEKAGHITGYR